MAITGFMESTVGTSEVFEGINRAIGDSGVNTFQKCVNLIKTAKHLTNEDIETAYITVRQMSDSLTKEAMKAFDFERVVLLYNKDPNLAVTQALPFITLKNKSGKYQTFVFVDKYITLSRDGVLSISAPVFRDLIVGGFISNALKTNYNMMASNAYLQKTLMDIYTKFFVRILNRQFSIIPDKVVFDTVQYYTNKFFLINIMGANTTAEGLETLATSSFKYIDDIKREEIKNAYDAAAPSKVSDLLELIKSTSARMKNLNMAIFLNDWTNYYFAPSMLAVDVIEYLIFMVLTLLSGNNIISIAASDIVKEQKNIKSLKEELLKLA